MLTTLLHQNDSLGEREKLAWLRLSRTENVGPVTFYRLIEAYGSAVQALDILPELSRRGGRKKPLSAPSEKNIEQELTHLKKTGGQIVTAGCPDYPDRLKAIDDAPPVISVIGNPALMRQSCIAMVGARNASLNGKKFAAKLARDLGEQSQVIVSGLARGIDTAAHEGSIETGTIAVVAGGIDVIYPEENTTLYKRICETGLVIAESPFSQQPFAQSFPRRNRIVSGLSKGVVVVEATKKSGSLITARLAGEQGRDVFAVPGHPLDPRAQGPNHLIRDGATLVRNTQDILEGLSAPYSGLAEPYSHMNVFPPAPANDPEIPENAQDLILDALSFTPVTVDELVRNCHVNVPAVQMILLELELAGRIKRLPGNRISMVESE